MKRTRVRQFVERLTAWHDPYWDLRRQPFITFEREIDFEEIRRMYPLPDLIPLSEFPPLPPGAVDRRIKYTVYSPLEVEVDPWPKRANKP